MTEQLEKKMSEEETQENVDTLENTSEPQIVLESHAEEHAAVDTGRKVDVSKVMLKKNMVRAIEKTPEPIGEAVAEPKIIILPRASHSEPRQEQARPRPHPKGKAKANQREIEI